LRRGLLQSWAKPASPRVLASSCREFFLASRPGFSALPTNSVRRWLLIHVTLRVLLSDVIAAINRLFKNVQCRRCGAMQRGDVQRFSLEGGAEAGRKKGGVSFRPLEAGRNPCGGQEKVAGLLTNMISCLRP
jgi:hypothetical protein